MSDGGYIQDTISLFADEIIRQKTGRYIQIPRKLKVFLDDNVRTERGREVAAALYSFIEMKSGELKPSFSGLNQRKKSNDWPKINHKSFAGLGSTATVSNYKRLLIDNGFIKQNDSYSTGRFSKSYKVKKYSDYVEQELRKINFLDLIETATAKDPVCKFTRSCLGRLEFNSDRLRPVIQQSVFEKIDKHPEGFQAAVNRIRPTKFPVIKICGKRGNVKRDEYGRLHSPFTQLKKDYRKLFTVESQDLMSGDMVCCQPSLLGLMSGDGSLLADSTSKRDLFYNHVIRCLRNDGIQATRDDAKRATYWYMYGSNKQEQTESNRPVWAVKSLFEAKYKVAAKYIWERKVGELYKNLSRDMQRLESRIFIDGLLNLFRKEKIFCLTVHDGLYFKIGDKPEVQKLVDDNLVAIISNLIDGPIDGRVASLKWSKV